MERDSRGADLEKEKKRAATRERIRKCRAKRSETSARINQPPMSTKERVQKYRLRKQQQYTSVQPSLPSLNPTQAPIIRSYPSAERTRRYHQRLRESRSPIKRAPLSKQQRNACWLAKKKQYELQNQQAGLVNNQEVRNLCSLL